jgi:hypothetical protein
MAKSEFINGLQELGYKTSEQDGNKVYIEYTAPVGKNIGKKALLGFIVDNSFPMNCPTGPHFKGLDGDWIHPPNNVNDSEFGSGWKYWSRPFPEWNASDRTVKSYLGHIKNLLNKL